jgi:RNA polymerase sigma-B factor
MMTTAPLQAAACPPIWRRTLRNHRVVSLERERPLLIHYREHRDPAALEVLVQRFLPLARALAGRFVETGEPLDDLRQVAALGLIKAIDRYDPARGTKFASFATPTILGELKRHVRDRGWAVHVPRELQERALAVGRETETLTSRLRRSPTPRELAEEMGCAVEDVLEAQEAASSYAATSLDAPLAGHEEMTDVAEVIGAEDRRYARVDDRDAIARGWRSLAENDRRVLELRFAQDLSQREIAARIGYSQMHVSRLLRRALDHLSAAATAPLSAPGSARRGA